VHQLIASRRSSRTKATPMISAAPLKIGSM
jgi:hypothetical protein